MRINRLALLAISLVFALLRVAHADCPKTGRYDVEIDSSPQGAPIYIGDKSCQVGVTPWKGKLNKGTYTVIIETPGYEPANKPFVVAAVRRSQPLFVPLTKKADPPKIDVQAAADPKGVSGATVMLDGEIKGQAPTIITTTAGRHQLRIQKDGYEPYEVWITATENQTQTMLPQMKEIAKPKYGTVVVDADVPDAEVYIDGNKHPDNTPAVISNVVEGLHVIEVKKPPSLPWKQTVQVTANQQTKVRADMLSTMNGGTGVIRVISDAPGARVFIDGTEMGPAPFDAKDQKAGDHLVQVKAPGMATGEKHVMVAAGQSQIVKFDLNQDFSGDMGLLKVVSTVPEAMVFIDGAAIGKVPVEKRMSAGEHPVVVRLEGFKQFEQKVRVEAGQTVTVQADLKAVGRLRVLTTPSGASVSINGLVVGKTPITDLDVETGETVLRAELPGFQAWEETLTIEGGKTKTLSRELAVAGPSAAEQLAEQRGLSSFGARTLPRGRSTIDFSAGYPYFVEGRVNVGAGKIANQFGFDATVLVRSMGARTELGIGGRAMLADNEPFSAAVFTELFYGSKLLDNSQRNGVTWNAGAVVSLTAIEHVTISGRAYLDVWSDRHCPSKNTDPTLTNPDGSVKVFEGDPISACTEYYNDFSAAANQDVTRIKKLTGWSTQDDVFGRETGARLMTSISAEIAADQHYNFFGILEGAPFQSERALFTNLFAHSMPDTDYILYVRLGMTYKF
jgi:hypothetical protein